MSFGQKAQEFSVFKLLISAIIALAILAVLMPIIGSIFLGFGTNPNDEAVTQIKNLYNKPSQHVLTKAVTFTQASGGLNSKSIATGTQLLSQSQLWLGTGDFSDGEEFALTTSGGIINYTGSGSKSVKLSIMCDAGKDIDTDLTENGLESIKPANTPPTACDTSSNETCCVILLRSA